MPNSELLDKAEQLANEIRRGPVEDRLSLRPKFAHLLSDMRGEGTSVPRRLQQLDSELSEEAAERQFDNMPV